MEVVSHQAYWRLKDGLKASLPTVHQHLKSDAVIVGGGISGLLTAHALLDKGVDCILIDSYDIGSGSTSACTALIQYEIDLPLVELMEKRGVEDAEKAYMASYESVEKLFRIANTIGFKGLKHHRSVYLASEVEDVNLLRREYSARKNLGFDVEFWTENDIRKQFPFRSPAALVSRRAAEMDPYLFTHALLSYNLARGLRAFDRSSMMEFKNQEKGVEVHLDNGCCIRTDHVIVATGYEAAAFLPRGFVDLRSTYAMVTKPIPDIKDRMRSSMFWETAHPYIYFRETPDNRILIGGEDENFTSPKLRDALLEAKTRILSRRLKSFFPDLQFEPAYSWAGTFCETRDGLPIIGGLRGIDSCSFALGFGGNGVSFSVIAAELVRDRVLGVSHPLEKVFSFDRFFRNPSKGNYSPNI